MHFPTISLLRNMANVQRGGSKYQFMETNTQRRSAGLKDKLPDIQKTWDTVRFLKTRKVPSSCLRASTSMLPKPLCSSAHG